MDNCEFEQDLKNGISFLCDVLRRNEVQFDEDLLIGFDKKYDSGKFNGLFPFCKHVLSEECSGVRLLIQHGQPYGIMCEALADSNVRCTNLDLEMEIRKQPVFISEKSVGKKSRVVIKTNGLQDEFFTKHVTVEANEEAGF